MKRFDGAGTVAGFFVRHPNAANLVMAMLILFGAYGLSKLNTQFFPTIETNRITISVSWPGASAEDAEANILQALEPEVRFVDGVDKVESYAREGAATIQLEFVQGADMQKALSDVEQAVNAVTTLPEDADTPTVSFRQWYDRVARIALTGPFSEAALKVYARKMRDDLIARGIDQVTFSGLRDEEYVVRIPEREMRRLDLTVADVSQRIAENTRDLPSGSVEGAVEKQIRTVSEGKSPSDLGRIDIKTFASGEKIRIRDIGTVEREFDKDQTRGFSGGERAIELTVSRAASADTLKTARILDDYLAEIRPQLPPTLNIVKYEIRADVLMGRINLLLENGLTGLILVVFVLYVFLNARIALWVAAGIPVAMMATVGFMWTTGQTINMMSLFALIMMLGIIVDDAIVVGEHTATRFALGDSAEEAAINGAGRMIAPVMAASLTTIAAFMPILLVRDVIGQIMSAIPMVVVAVLVASLVECFLVLPGHLAHSLSPRRRAPWSWWRHGIIAAALALFLIGLAARADVEVTPLLDGPADSLRALRDWFAALPLATSGIPLAGTLLFDIAVILGAFAAAGLVELVFFLLRRRSGRGAPAGASPETGETGWFRSAFDAGFARFRDGPFRGFVALSFRWRYVTLATAAAALIVAFGFFAGGRVGFVLFPSPEAENLRATVYFNAGIPEEKAVSALKQIEAALRTAEKRLTKDEPQQLIIASYVTLGEAGRSQGDNVAGIDVQLTASEVRTIRSPDIVQGWRRALPDIAGVRRIAIFERRGGPPGRDIDIQLQNAPAARLKAASLEVQELLSAFPGVSGVADDLPYGKPELVMELTPRGRALGFTVDNVGRQIRNAFQGVIARRFAAGDQEIAIRVLKEMPAGVGAGALRDLSLRAPSGEYVPLSEVVTLTDRQGFSAILRTDGKTSVSVTGDVDFDVTSNEEIIQRLQKGELADIAARHGVDYRFSGRAEERKKSFDDLKIGTLIALGSIYLILAWVFASYFSPLAVMAIIPFGIVGAVFGHYLLGFKLTILSLIGLLGLSGILVNDSIILVGRYDERRAEGESILQAAVGASQDRLRAVLLTSLTTIGGLLPLLFEQSIQARFLLPMAITIVFGLGVATLLVLFLIPALLGVGGDIATLYRAIYNRRHPDGHHHAPHPAE